MAQANKQVSGFEPAWWLSNGHLQTIYPALFRRITPPDRVRERVLLSDGDWLYLDWHVPEPWLSSGKPLVLILHGLAGCSSSQYVVGLQHALATMGWGSVAMNCRGATGEPNNSARAYHAGAHDDVAEVIANVSARYPGVPLALVGYSLGGAMTLNYLALYDVPKSLFAAAAISVPLQLGLCADRLNQGVSRVYRKHLLDQLQLTWAHKANHLEQLGDEEMASHIRDKLAGGPYTSFRVMDDVLVAGIHGFKDGDDYYERCSPRQQLARIRVNTLLLQAADDPFLAPGCYPELDELSPNVHLEIPACGGHVGFIEAGLNWREPRYYLERRIPQFLQSMLGA